MIGNIDHSLNAFSFIKNSINEWALLLDLLINMLLELVNFTVQLRHISYALL